MKFVGALVLLIASVICSAQTESVIYNFQGGYPYNGNGDGVEPTSSLTPDGKGGFFGTTCLGGWWGRGTVYELSSDSSGAWSETVIHHFRLRWCLSLLYWSCGRQLWQLVRGHHRWVCIW